MSSEPPVPSSSRPKSPSGGVTGALANDLELAVGRASLDGSLRIVGCDGPARHLLGVPDPENDAAALSAPLTFSEVFAHDGAAWLEEAVRLGTGLDERAVHTRSGRVVRVHAEGSDQLLIVDDTGRSAVEASASLAACDEARAQLAAAVARDLNDSMSVVQGRLELLLELGDSEGTRRHARHLEVALGHARRVSATLHLLRMVGRPPPFSLAPVSAREVIRRAVRGLPGPDPTVVLEPPDLHVSSDEELLERVIRGLLSRLSEATHRGLEPRIHAFEDNGRARIDLAAAPPETLPDVSRATPAPDDPRVDVGVAALVLERVSTRLRGLRLGRGLVFRLELPAAGGPSRASLRDVEVMAVGPCSTVVSRLLEAQGAAVHAPDHAQAALETLASGHHLAGLVVDMDLPGVSGLGFAREVVRRWPRLHGCVVLVSRHRPEGRLPGIAWCRPPLSRDALLQGLGRAGDAP